MSSTATPGLGDRSYLVHDGELAFVVDPQRDVDRLVDLAHTDSVRITHIFETHVHNDYVSGGLELARRTGATIVSATAEPLSFDHHGVADGDELSIGRLQVQAMHTPGHTHHHLAYVVQADGEPRAVFTGGSLLFGTVGRTDLMGPAAAVELARAQYHSARSLLDTLPSACAVHPTHGFGSFCASAQASDVADSTIGRERLENIAARVEDEDSFAKDVLRDLTAAPAYYAHIPHLNRAGPQPLDLSPPRLVDPRSLVSRLGSGEWVVDLRSRRLFARDHVSGTISIELDDPFAVYVGWIVPWGSPITLLAEDPDAITEAQISLARIGIDRPAGAGIDTVAELAPDRRSSFPVASFRELRAALEDRSRAQSLTVLDVRRRDEWSERHIAGSVNIPIHELLDHLHHVPDGELWTHCASGYRAAIAASLLERAGHDVVLVDDEWEHAAPAGLNVSDSG